MSLKDDIATINFSSIQRAGDGFRDVVGDPGNVGPAVGAALELSETRALRLARGIFVTAPDADRVAREAEAMVRWAAKAGSAERQVVGRALRLSDAGVFAVHEIGNLPRQRARPFMADYLAAGGDLKDVAQWLEVVGGVLRRHAAKADGTAGIVVDAAEWVAGAVEDAVDAVSEAVETVVDAVVDAGHTIAEVVSSAVTWTSEQVANVVRALVEAGRAVGEILATAAAAGVAALDRFVRAVIEAGRSIGEVLAWAVTQTAEALRTVVAAARAAGAAIIDVIRWAVAQAADVVRAVVRAIVDVGIAVVDLIAQVASAGLAAMRAVVDALFAIGRTLTSLVRAVAGLALDALELFIRAAIAAGKTVLELGRSALALTYRAIKHLVKAAFRAGIAAVELLGAVAGAGYFELRKMISAVLDAAGPVGDVLDWALSRFEQAADDVFRGVLSAMRFAEATLTDALDWAAAQTDRAFELVIGAWEAMGEKLIDVYRWARGVGEQVWERIGRFTQRVQNSVTYVLLYLEKDFVPGVARFVKGLLEAGYVLADLVVRLAARALDLVVEAVGAILDLGFTLTDLLLATLADPRRLMDNIVAAVRAAGRTARELFVAAEDAGADAVAELKDAWRRLQAPLDEMLQGAWEVGGGLFGTVVSLLLNELATYRPLTAEEKRVGRLVFADTIDLDTVSISAESLDNDIIFGVQNFFDGTPGSRAFVTTTLINIDASQPFTNATLVHELTHVWQALTSGPFYLSEAIHAQVTNPDAYNYGYTNRADGTGGGDDLAAANGNLAQFNPEQQGQIAMHYYVRRHEGTSFVLDTATSDLSGGGAFSRRLARANPTAASFTVTVAAGVTADSLAFTDAGIPGVEGLAGPLAVRLSVAGGDPGVRCSVAAARVDAAGIVQATSAFTPARPLPAGDGTLAFTLASANLGPWQAGDRLRLAYRFRNTTPTQQAFEIKTGTGESEVAGHFDWAPWQPYIDVIQAA